MAFGEPAAPALKQVQAKVDTLISEARQKRNERASFINETYRLAKPHRRKVGQMPGVSPILSSADIADIVDATLAETVHDFASDMIQQFTPESEYWVNFDVKETVPDEYLQEVKLRASQTQTMVFEAIQESTYFDAAPQCFQDLANGTMAARGRRPKRGGDPYEVEAIDPCDLLICQSPGRGIADTRATEAKIKVAVFKEIYAAHGIQLPQRSTPWRDEDEIVVIDGFYRCWENMRGAAAWRRFVTVDTKVVWETYFADDPDVDIIVSRWETDGQSGWGVGPAFRAQPAQRALNELTALMMVAAAKHVDPPFTYTDDGVANFTDGFEAGDGIAVGETFEFNQLETRGQMDLSFFTEQNLRQVIRHALFQDKPEQVGKTPPTAEQWGSLEVRSRQRWEIPRGKIVREWVLPWVNWFQKGLEVEGKLGPDVYTVGKKLFKILPNSPFAKARQQEQVVRSREILSTFAQFSPETLPIDVDLAATMRNVKSALNDELIVIRTDEERVQAAQMMAQAQGGGAPGGGDAQT